MLKLKANTVYLFFLCFIIAVTTTNYFYQDTDTFVQFIGFFQHKLIQFCK